MEITVPEIVTYILAWFATMSGIWALFDRAETVLHKDVLLKISKWLKKDSTFSFMEWPIIFNLFFDQVFGEKHFTFKCFYRSMITSIISVILFVLIIQSISDYAVLNSVTTISEAINYISILFLFTFFFNVITDYISLIGTRMVLKWMLGKSFVVRLFFLLLDFILSLLIFLVMYFILSRFYMLLMGVEESLKPSTLDSISNSLKMIFNYITFSPINSESSAGLAPWVYSTFVPSLWIWLFLIGGLILKTLNKLSIGFNKLKSFFDLEVKPLKSIGFMWMILATIMFIILLFT